jgi:hypothetical protein
MVKGKMLALDHRSEFPVNLLSRHERKEQSHDIAKRHKARLALAEVPPGLPMLPIIVAEICGPDDASRFRLASGVKKFSRRRRGWSRSEFFSLTNRNQLPGEAI